MTELSRRHFLGKAGALPMIAAILPELAHAAAGAGEDSVRTRIALSDLQLSGPVSRPEAGFPLGNGVMGCLVWTVPSGLRMQINRVDVYAAGSASESFVEPHKDYCGGCAFVDIDLAGLPFAGSSWTQHLSVNDGVLSIRTPDLTIRIVPARARDVLAIEIEDRRAVPREITAALRALRYDPASAGAQPGASAAPGVSAVRTRAHLARTRVQAIDDGLALEQAFSEADFSCHTAVTLGLGGGHRQAALSDDSCVRLQAPGRRPTHLYIASAASFERDAKVLDDATRQMRTARDTGFAKIVGDTSDWWARFWARGTLALSSADGVAQALQRDYHYFLYLMASASGGALPPKFNGMLWNSGGDARAWGAQHWYTNASCYYEMLPASGRTDLMDPLFAMYSAMLPACERAARDQWGSQGHFIPETTFFDGPAPLPGAIAAEMRALYLGGKSWDERSAAFREVAGGGHPYSQPWNWKGAGTWRHGRFVTGERGNGCYGPVSHILAATAKVAWLYWQRYEYTLDTEFLAQSAYPMLRGALEFYRYHPLVTRGADGRVHISGTNNSEPVRGARDTNEDLSAMAAIAAATLKASETLKVDADRRADWRAFRAALAPLPMSDDADVLGGRQPGKHRTFAAARAPAVFANPAYLRPDPNSLPSWFFGLCGRNAGDSTMREAAGHTLEALLEEHGPHRASWNNGLTKLPIAAALAGRADLVRNLLPRQMAASGERAGDVLANGRLLFNRMSLGEGLQALSAQHLGRAAQALQLALLQSEPPAPGEAPLLRLFPAWPADWDAAFTLAARGGFTVDAVIRGGRVMRVALTSSAGADCTLVNPFDGPVLVQRGSGGRETLDRPILNLKTHRGETIVLSATVAPGEGTTSDA